MSDFITKYLLGFEFTLRDKPGTLSEIIKYFSRKNINIASTYSFTNRNNSDVVYKIDVESEIVLDPNDIIVELKASSNLMLIDLKLTDIIKSTVKRVEYSSIFISYSSRDKEFVKFLTKRLKNENIDFWVDEKDFMPGDKIQNKISQGINKCDKFLLVCSKHSLTSWWVDREFEEALLKESNSKGNVLIPINLDNKIFDKESNYEKKYLVLTRHIGDFTKWKEPEVFNDSFDKLLMACEK